MSYFVNYHLQKIFYIIIICFYHPCEEELITPPPRTSRVGDVQVVTPYQKTQLAAHKRMEANAKANKKKDSCLGCCAFEFGILLGSIHQ